MATLRGIAAGFSTLLFEALILALVLSDGGTDDLKPPWRPAIPHEFFADPPMCAPLGQDG